MSERARFSIVPRWPALSSAPGSASPSTSPTTQGCSTLRSTPKTWRRSSRSSPNRATCCASSATAATNTGEAPPSSPRMYPAPVLGDVAAGGDPHTVARRDVVEKADQPGDPARAPDQPVVHRQRHQPWPVGALGIERLEAIDHVAGEIVAGREPAVLVEAVVVGLERIGDDEVARAANRHPVWQFVVEAVAVVEKGAEFEMEAPGIGARAPGHPADGTHPGHPLQGLDAAPDMLPLLVHRHPLVVEPAIAVADDLVSVGDKGA